MRFKFSKDKEYNPIGANHTRVQAKAGEVHDLPAYLCQMLSDYGSVVGAGPTEKPQAAPQEQKSEYPKYLGGGWYELSDGSKVQGKDKAIEKQDELNG